MCSRSQKNSSPAIQFEAQNPDTSWRRQGPARPCLCPSSQQEAEPHSVWRAWDNFPSAFHIHFPFTVCSSARTMAWPRHRALESDRPRSKSDFIFQSLGRLKQAICLFYKPPFSYLKKGMITVSFSQRVCEDQMYSNEQCLAHSSI